MCNVSYLKQQLDKIGYPSWVNEYSNTVFMRCPSPELAHKYQLAQNEDARFGGKLAHVVVSRYFIAKIPILFPRMGKMFPK